MTSVQDNGSPDGTLAIPASRRPSRQVRVGDLTLGGEAPVRVQSMTNTDTRDVPATVDQIEALAEAGCELVRVAVPDAEAAAALAEIKAAISLPLVADIHFDYRLALAAIEAGVDKLRLNPGNIGGPERVRAVVEAARPRGIPIRIGVNAGSLEKEILARHGGRPTAAGMVESALRHVRLLEDLDYPEIVLSVKAFDVPTTVAAYRALAERVPYPLHLGITESGTATAGLARSAVGLGILLAEGIGDTLRVSLTGDPAEEVKAAYEILKSLNLRQYGVTIISCPTCGRCQIDLAALTREVERRLADLKTPVTVAVMGCVVNGPGEAREADVGIAGGRHEGLLFRRGEVIGKLPEGELVDALVAAARQVALQKTGTPSPYAER